MKVQTQVKSDKMSNLHFMIVRPFNFAVIMFLIMFSVTMGLFSSVHAQVDEDMDKTMSPYFFVRSDDPDLDQLPLKSTSAEINIAGVIADIRVTQVYKNEGKKTLEAIYIFPASTRAAVYGMQMTIGERTIIAKIDRKSSAREQYEQAREEGYTAALLEQQRPNVFQMNVANILPGDVVKVEMRYTELLNPQDKQYEFVYPSVVGPRYSGSIEENSDKSENWLKNPYLEEGQSPHYDFDLKIALNSAVPIHKVTSTSHQVNISYMDKKSARIELMDSEKNGGNRDFILKYQLADKKIQTGLMLFEGSDENFFLAMIQPPDKTTSNLIVSREYVFIIDVSGSMNGFPISITKKLMRNLLGKLKPSEKFNVLLFAGGSRVFNQNSVSATEENINKAIYMIDNEHGSGGTELLPALKRAMALPQSEGFSRTAVIVTDGYVSVEREAFDLIRDSLSEANVFTFGIGSSVNRYLIEGLSRVGKGESFVITKPTEAEAKAEKFRKYIKSPLLTNIKIEFDSFDVYSVEPALIPDVFAERPILIYGKYRGKAQGRIKLTGIAGNNKNFSTQLKVANSKPEESNSALTYLWARERITLLSDYGRISQNDQEIEEVTSLGLKYSLLTAYTSFVAIDSEIRNSNGQLTTVNQPLPLPQAVSNMAVRSGGVAGSGWATQAKMYKSGGPAESLEAETDAAANTQYTKIKLVSVQVSKKADQEEISKVMHSHMPVIEYCYNKIIQQLTELFPEGEIEIKIVFSASGRPNNVVVIKDELKNTDIVDCILKRVKTYRIKGSNDQSETEVTLLFSFEKLNQRGSK